MREFIENNWLFLVLVAGVLLAITVIYLLFSLVIRKRVKHNQRLNTIDDKQNNEVKISLKDLIDSEIMKPAERQESSQLSRSLETKAKDSPIVTESKPIDDIVTSEEEERHVVESLEPAEEYTKNNGQETENLQDVASETKAKPTAAPEIKQPKTEKKKELGKYHVLYRKEDKQWYIKREGSDRIIRVLETQREAIAYATIKAITQDTGFVVHKQDGKIRKQG